MQTPIVSHPQLLHVGTVAENISQTIGKLSWYPLLPEIWISGQPKSKSRPRGRLVSKKNSSTGAKTIFYTPFATRIAESNLKQAIRPYLYYDSPHQGPIKMELLFAIQRPKRIKSKSIAAFDSRADLDNLEKLIDALNNLVWLDDRQIIAVNKAKIYSSTPHTEIAIWGADEAS